MIKTIVRHREVSILSFAAIFFVVAGSVWAYLALRGVANAPLILHFDDISGITSVGSLSSLVAIGALATILTILNFLIALEFDARDRFFGKIIAVLGLILAILLFLAFAAIINVN